MPAAQEPTTTDELSSDVASALVAEATRKAGLVWLAYGDAAATAAPRPAWHVWHDDAAYLICGDGEQSLPELTKAAEVTVVVPSKDTRARLVTWAGRVELVVPGTDGWVAAASALAAGRLNAEGGAAMIDRWSRECHLVRIVPTGAVIETANAPASTSLAAPPRPTEATTLGRQPRMVGGIRRRGRP